jgi:hypothetical protein
MHRHRTIPRHPILLSPDEHALPPSLRITCRGSFAWLPLPRVAHSATLCRCCRVAAATLDRAGRGTALAGCLCRGPAFSPPRRPCPCRTDRRTRRPFPKVRPATLSRRSFTAPARDGGGRRLAAAGPSTLHGCRAALTSPSVLKGGKDLSGTRGTTFPDPVRSIPGREPPRGGATAPDPERSRAIDHRLCGMVTPGRERRRPGGGRRPGPCRTRRPFPRGGPDRLDGGVSGPSTPDTPPGPDEPLTARPAPATTRDQRPWAAR